MITLNSISTKPDKIYDEDTMKDTLFDCMDKRLSMKRQVSIKSKKEIEVDKNMEKKIDDLVSEDDFENDINKKTSKISSTEFGSDMGNAVSLTKKDLSGGLKSFLKGSLGLKKQADGSIGVKDSKKRKTVVHKSEKIKDPIEKINYLVNIRSESMKIKEILR